MAFFGSCASQPAHPREEGGSKEVQGLRHWIGIHRLPLRPPEFFRCGVRRKRSRDGHAEEHEPVLGMAFQARSLFFSIEF